MNAAEILHLWEFLAQTWGNRFLEEYGAKPNNAWSMALAGIKPDAAKLALSVLIREGSGFPPTLPEFIAAASKWRPPQSRAEVTTLTLPQRPDNETLKRNIQRLRETLNSPDVIKPMDPR
jgi:hypothetical protein